MVMHDCQPLLMLAYKSNGLLGFVDLTEVQCISLVKQLLEGVGFLHEHNIAHLDIKFSNLVIDHQSNKLLIIDYGLPQQLKSKETMLAGYRGTEGYAAPEVDNDKPFNPICADLWSTGTVIHELLNLYSSWEAQMKLEYLNAISCKLMDSNPAARPLASEAMAMLEYATFPMESYFMKAISFLEFVNPAV
ncbi:9325_t:CDS:1 [Paraglomus brasilianum]|uniref:9325_t:CDS:1 n=1 Tax=Paraglomus brasilianum TaxID=144538 RepID=A0A9N9HFH5_9GLOM|nr:9325_t:CDS:1 [Paraglomus brasilianum]